MGLGFSNGPRLPDQKCCCALHCAVYFEMVSRLIKESYRCQPALERDLPPSFGKEARLWRISRIIVRSECSQVRLRSRGIAQMRAPGWKTLFHYVQEYRLMQLGAAARKALRMVKAFPCHLPAALTSEGRPCWSSPHIFKIQLYVVYFH